MNGVLYFDVEEFVEYFALNLFDLGLTKVSLCEVVEFLICGFAEIFFGNGVGADKLRYDRLVV